MKRIFLGGFAISALLIVAPLSTASAAPPPPPAPAPVSSWTGFYVGGNVGGAWLSTGNMGVSDPNNTLGLSFAPATSPPALVPVNFSATKSGVIGGGQVGWNWQFAPTWLVGIEGDFDWTSMTAQATFAPLISPAIAVNSFANASEQINSIFSVRGRLGYVMNQWLLYATGGGAWANTNFAGNLGCPNTGFDACGANYLVD